MRVSRTNFRELTVSTAVAESITSPSSPAFGRPELLAPVGSVACLPAAVENGADAVYFGLDVGFNARARAANLSLDEAAEAMKYLHQRGVKGFVTLNTLAFSDELPEVVSVVRAITRMGVDAVLVQDIGVARLIRALSPDLPLHASTQMTLTSAEGIAVAAELGIERVVLARELSLDEIRSIRKHTDIELEVFVHGALCVAYSGQCLTSESLGGRSANRGQCAQACRLPYELICDGQDVDLGAQKYLLSPQDLAAYELTPELIAAGVNSFKIEGRLKTPEYVANITRRYRAAIDAAMAHKPVILQPDARREMELSFSRGFAPGWLEGCDHKRLVPALSSTKRGVLLGEVVRVLGDRVEVQLNAPIKRGDGVVFEGDRTVEHGEQGGRVFGVWRGRQRLDEAISSGLVQLEFQIDSLDYSRIVPGQKIWKTDDPELTARLRQSFSSADPVRRVDADFKVTGHVGEPLQITATTATGVTTTASSAEPLQAARTRPATVDFFREQLGRLGHTVFRLRDVQCDIAGSPMVPLSVLSHVRQELLRELTERNGQPPARTLSDGDVLATMRVGIQTDVTTAENVVQLHVLCRKLDQLRAAALSSSVATLYADFQDIREYREAVPIAHAAGKTVWLAPPRIQKPDEFGIFLALQKWAPDGWLVRNLAGMQFCQNHAIPFVLDYTLNVTNELTADWLMASGAARLTASYDLNREQLLDLVRHTPPAWIETVIHQHMPMFHMEHCVFCAVLSPGTNKTNCGRPCDNHLVQLRDRVGAEHPLKADVGCRNTLYNSRPQSAAEIVPTLIERGVRHFRIELLDENVEQTRRTISLYRDLLDGVITGDTVWQALEASNRVGVTRGTLEERRNPLAIL
jgi:U32 family peptidase